MYGMVDCRSPVQVTSGATPYVSLDTCYYTQLSLFGHLSLQTTVSIVMLYLRSLLESIHDSL